MSDSKFKTMRHIETVRNYLNVVIVELLRRQEAHDQSKLESEEVDTFDRVTARLRALTYGSEEYHVSLRELGPALAHHYAHNRHHPEFHQNGISDMTLIDLLEMVIDWKCSSMRHTTGDMYQSLEINQSRFGYSDELKRHLFNTVRWLDDQTIYHKAHES